MRTAQNFNTTSLAAFESLFADALVPALTRVREIARGEGQGWSLFFDSINRLLSHDGQGGRLPLTPAISHEERVLRGLLYGFFAPTALLEAVPVLRVTADNLIAGPRALVRYAAHSERYPLAFPALNQVDVQDDEMQSWERTRARICIQTAGFSEHYRDFQPLCEGAILRSPGVHTSYQNLIDIRQFAESAPEAQRLERTRFSRRMAVCALRRHRLRSISQQLTESFAAGVR